MEKQYVSDTGYDLSGDRSHLIEGEIAAAIKNHHVMQESQLNQVIGEGRKFLGLNIQARRAKRESAHVAYSAAITDYQNICR